MLRVILNIVYVLCVRLKNQTFIGTMWLQLQSEMVLPLLKFFPSPNLISTDEFKMQCLFIHSVEFEMQFLFIHLILNNATSCRVFVLFKCFNPQQEMGLCKPL